MERAPRRMFAAIFFKKKNVVGEKASRSAYDQLYRLWLGYLILLQCQARQYAHTRIADTISIKILCARSIFFYKSVLFHAMLPSEGSRLDDPN